MVKNTEIITVFKYFLLNDVDLLFIFSNVVLILAIKLYLLLIR